MTSEVDEDVVVTRNSSNAQQELVQKHSSGTSSSTITRNSSKTQKEVVRRYASMMKSELSEDTSIMRGVSLSALLGGFCSCIRSGPTTDPTIAAVGYAKSFEVAHLQVFLSHSWHANAKIKALALLQHHNGDAAAVFGFLCGIICSICDLLGFLPAWACDVDNAWYNLWSPGGPDKVDIRGWGLLAFTVGYSCALLWWHRILLVLSCDSKLYGSVAVTSIFLDKLCIHQTDEQLRKKGIRFIGHYLLLCDEMLVVLDSTYFTRLWCIFELATFLSLNAKGKLALLPMVVRCVQVACVYVCSITYLCLYAFAGCGFIPWLVESLRALDFQEPSILIMMTSVMQGPVIIGAMFVLRAFARSRIIMRKQIKQISLVNARCAEEQDRRFVESVVADLYKDVGSFEAVMRREVDSAMHQQFGPYTSLPYRFHIPWMLAFLMASVDMAVTLQSASFSYALHWLCGCAFLIFVQLASLIRIFEYCSQWRLETQSYLEDMCVVAIITALGVVCLSCIVFLSRFTFGEAIGHKVIVSCPFVLMMIVIWLWPMIRLQYRRLQFRRSSMNGGTGKSTDVIANVTNPAVVKVAEHMADGDYDDEYDIDYEFI